VNNMEIRKAIQQAESLAAEVSQTEYRKAAFEILLQHYLRGNGGEVATARPSTPVGETREPSPIPDAHVVKSGSRDQQAIWAVLTLVSRDQEATCAAIAKAIKDELGHAPESTGNLSYRMKQLTPRYVSRVKSGKGYAYRPTKDAPSIFAKSDKK
jgi:hypothetical protein